ncbi:serine--tRNA ligase [Chelatococcus reniformis]|uniref:Serine--tRNA ligase n=1 Tax=Chelatococcus reniformis TaxID=1494448 RepID=A0A916UD76_9HYPH|nr:serine--tRNA ligase [Chelatococcus reniformis]GGC69356.1 serine--tRNA ligase [Chelatococcus reniformis]
MHDIRLIRDDPATFDAGLKRRGLAPLSSVLIALDERRRAAIAAAQAAQERRNALSREIGEAMRAKDAARAEALKAEVAALKDGVPALERDERNAAAALDGELAAIPNLPAPEVPDGGDEHDNIEKSRFGMRADERTDQLVGVNAPKQHFELGEALGLMDFEAAAKLSGSRFVVVKGHLARLERAIGQFMIDLHTTEHGYEEVNPPLLVRDEVMFGTAQLPKFADDQFTAARTLSRHELLRAALSHATPEDGLAFKAGEIDIETLVDRVLERAPLKEDFWLIPTAEVPLTNLVRESILAEEELPKRFTALTPCFRAEAGAAGRDTRGMLRQHQFQKVELVSITVPEASREEHERMLACAEAVLQRLDLHYRVMTLCTGDMGFASAKTYDIEVWLPGQQAYREVSSCSTCNDFQARRMNARTRARDARQTRFVHTLNGSGTAVGRALIAVMETYQNADGSVTVPSALAPYMGGITRIERPLR